MRGRRILGIDVQVCIVNVQRELAVAAARQRRDRRAHHLTDAAVVGDESPPEPPTLFNFERRHAEWCSISMEANTLTHSHSYTDQAEDLARIHKLPDSNL
jgi:hypothetical protein